MKIHTVELWPGAPELHEVVLHSEHIQALARVEAEHADDVKRYRQLLNEAGRDRYAAQKQLAEAVGLLKHVKDWFGWGDLPESLSKLDAFLARHAQAEQQEAPERGKPDWNSHGYDQIFQASDGNWFGARAGWDFKGHISEAWKGREVSLLRDDGSFLAYGEPNPDWENSLEQRPAQEAQGAQAGDEPVGTFKSFEALLKNIEATWFAGADLIRRRDIAQRKEIAELSAALATQPAAVSDLLAVIHRDGGHYLDQHGLEKAARDAEAIVQAERATQPAAEPVAWMIDWPDEPEIGHYFSESPDELTGSRSRPLFTNAPPAAAHGDEAVPADLKARCQEIVQWRKSGVLRGDALRKYAESRWPGDPSALQMAEHETATEAFQVVSAMRAQAGEGGAV